MREGTVSVLVGCHSPIHSILVVRSWIKLYGRWPRPWELGCIFLHDVGHWGLDYLSNPNLKYRHWIKGARIARKLYGNKGYDLIAGHCPEESGFPMSGLCKPDKYSHMISPTWFEYWNTIVEPKLLIGCKSRMDAVRRFKAATKKNVMSGDYRSTHQLYLERCQGKDKTE